MADWSELVGPNGEVGPGVCGDCRERFGELYRCPLCLGEHCRRCDRRNHATGHCEPESWPEYGEDPHG